MTVLIWECLWVLSTETYKPVSATIRIQIRMKEVTYCLPKEVICVISSLWSFWSLCSLMWSNCFQRPAVFPSIRSDVVIILGKAVSETFFLIIVVQLAFFKLIWLSLFQVVQFQSDMLCPSNMAGSSELEVLWPLPTLRGQSYTTHFLFFTGSVFRIGAETWWVAQRFSGECLISRRCCPASRPTAKRPCVETKAEIYPFLFSLAFHPQ